MQHPQLLITLTETAAHSQHHLLSRERPGDYPPALNHPLLPFDQIAPVLPSSFEISDAVFSVFPPVYPAGKAAQMQRT